MKNRNWNFKNFPSTDPRRVRNHLALGMIQFSTLSFLKHHWNRATWELDRWVREFIRICIDIAVTSDGYEFVATINEKSEEVKFQQDKSSLEDLYGIGLFEPEEVGPSSA